MVGELLMKDVKKRVKEVLPLVVGIGLVILIRHVMGIGCPIKWLFGISCPGCGMTRAIMAAVQFQFKNAFYFHPLFWSMPLFAGLIFWEDKLPQKIRKSVIPVAAVLFAAVWLIRLMGGNVVVTADSNTGMLFRVLKLIAIQGGYK